MYDKITSPLFRYNSERLIMKRLKNINLFINEKENLKSYLDFQQKLNLSVIISFTLKKALSKINEEEILFLFFTFDIRLIDSKQKNIHKNGKVSNFFNFFYTHLKIVLGILITFLIYFFIAF